MGEAIRPANAIREGRRITVAVPDLVERAHDVTAASEFDDKAVLGRHQMM